MSSIRAFLSVQAAAFAAASLVHAGVLASGYEHREASIAEGVIAIGLAVGLAAGMMAPRWARAAALVVQAFALIGTFVGITMIAIGVGPQSAFDVVLHAGFVTLLVIGLIVVSRRGHPIARRA